MRAIADIRRARGCESGHRSCGIVSDVCNNGYVIVVDAVVVGVVDGDCHRRRRSSHFGVERVQMLSPSHVFACFADRSIIKAASGNGWCSQWACTVKSHPGDIDY